MKSFMILAMGILLLLSTGCEAAPPKGSRPKGWVKHSSPSGFVVQHPQGWSVKEADDGLILIQSADKAARVVVQPFFLHQSISAEQWLRQVPIRFDAVFPQARLQATRRRQQQPDEAFASMTYSAGGKPGRGNLLCSIDARSGMLFAIAAPEKQFAAQRETMVGVLRTFSFTHPTASPKGPAGEPAERYVRWQDPRENAFSLEVPSQWKVSGGLFRFASVDTRPAWEVVSPDGQIRITGGDAEIPPFTMPNSMLQSLGFAEGSWYSPGYGVKMMVKRYLPGVAFAREYVTTKISRGCSEVSFTETRDRPDAVQAINAIYAQYGNPGFSVNQNAGEVAFTCRKGGQPMSGYYFATTQLTQAYEMGGVWNVTYLLGYLAPGGKVRQAQSVANRILKSIQLNPQWAAMQQNITADTSKIVSRTNEEISNLISDSYWSRQRVRDDLSRKWSNMTLGQTDVVDPGTGETWKVASGHNYYWRKGHTELIAGTETYDRPDIDFTPLKEW